MRFVGGTSRFVNAHDSIWYTTAYLKLANLFIDSTRDIGTGHGFAGGGIPFTEAFSALHGGTLTLSICGTWLPDFTFGSWKVAIVEFGGTVWIDSACQIRTYLIPAGGSGCVPKTNAWRGDFAISVEWTDFIYFAIFLGKIGTTSI